MKKELLLQLIGLLLVGSLYAQVPTISTVKFGSLKLGMSIDSINKYVETKLSIRRVVDKEDFGWDTVNAVYKQIPVRLMISQTWDYETEKMGSALEGIYTESPLVSTKSGIKVGQNKFDVIKKLDGSVLTIRPEPDLGKNISSVNLYDQENYNEIIFYFRNNILYAIECRIVGEDGC